MKRTVPKADESLVNAASQDSQILEISPAVVKENVDSIVKNRKEYIKGLREAGISRVDESFPEISIDDSVTIEPGVELIKEESSTIQWMTESQTSEILLQSDSREEVGPSDSTPPS